MTKVTEMIFMLSAIAAVYAESKIADLTSDTLDEALKDRALFVKFYSPNCPHCQRLSPVWEQLASAAPFHPEAFFVADVDCTSESILCERFAIRGVPTLLFFKEGKMYKFAGKRDYNDIMKFGTGDYVNAAESGDIPPAGGMGIVGQTAYSLHNFLKDLLAMVRFNYMAVLFLVLSGAGLGSLATFAIMLTSVSKEVEALREQAARSGEKVDYNDGAPEEVKSIASKKVD